MRPRTEVLIDRAREQGQAEKRAGVGASRSTQSPAARVVTVTGEPARLSSLLRSETSSLHEQVEREVGLPGSIRGMGDYTACLARFYRLYLPLEMRLEAFDEWGGAGLAIKDRSHSGRLASDLRGLGLVPGLLPMLPVEALPQLPTFAHAFGALYVLEGSTLGGQFILRRLEEVLGAELTGATAFFGGHGEQTPGRWKTFQECLDRYGAAHPASLPQVVAGASATFHAVAGWMGNAQPR